MRVLCRDQGVPVGMPTVPWTPCPQMSSFWPPVSVVGLWPPTRLCSCGLHVLSGGPTGAHVGASRPSAHSSQNCLCCAVRQSFPGRTRGFEGPPRAAPFPCVRAWGVSTCARQGLQSPGPSPVPHLPLNMLAALGFRPLSTFWGLCLPGIHSLAWRDASL